MLCLREIVDQKADANGAMGLWQSYCTLFFLGGTRAWAWALKDWCLFFQPLSTSWWDYRNFPVQNWKSLVSLGFSSFEFLQNFPLILGYVCGCGMDCGNMHVPLLKGKILRNKYSQATL